MHRNYIRWYYVERFNKANKEGMLVRISQGIYLYPMRNRFGILKPSIDDIAVAIAQKDKAGIIPSGLTALNKLALSTQVTMNAVYLTDATAREIKIGNRTIVFKQLPLFHLRRQMLFSAMTMSR